MEDRQAAAHCTACVAAQKLNTTQAKGKNNLACHGMFDAKCFLPLAYSLTASQLQRLERVWVVIDRIPVAAQGSLTGCISPF